MATQSNNELHQQYTKGLEQVFKLYQAPNTEVMNFIATCLLVKDASILLNGIYGTGKTQLIRIIRKTFFSDGNGDTDYGYVTCTQDLTAMDTLYDIDLASLIQGKEVVTPRALVSARFKFINEVKRANSLVYNALLSLLSEKMVIHRGQTFVSPDYLCFLDANPSDAGSSEVPQAFIDRIDFSLELPLMSSGGLLKLQEQAKQCDLSHWADLAEQAEFFMTSKQMGTIWSDVQMVQIPENIMQLLAMLGSYLQQCHHVDRAVARQDYALPCGHCTYRAESCSKLLEVPGSRFLLSSLRLAQARAWLQSRDSVEVDDILWGLPYTLSHRLKVKADSLRQYANMTQWVKEELYQQNLRSKIPAWQQMLHQSGAKSEDDETPLENYASVDLAMDEYLRTVRV